MLCKVGWKVGKLQSIIMLLSLILFGLNLPKISMIAVFIPILSYRGVVRLNYRFIVGFILLVFFGYIYYSISCYDGLIAKDRGVIEFFFIVGIYLLGTLYVRNDRLFEVLVASIGGFCIFTFVSVIYSYTHPELINIEGRLICNVWNPSAKINAPILGSYITVCLATFPFVFLKEFSKKNRHLLLMLFLLALFSNIILSNRTPFLVAIMVWFGFFLFTLKLKTKVIVIFSLLLIIVVISNFIDQIPILNMIIGRFTENGLNTPRFKLWQDGFENLFLNPFGGGLGDKGIYSAYHNTWLDIGDYAGIAPFIILVIFQIFHFMVYLSFPKTDILKIKRENQLLLVVLLAFYLSCLGEPILIGSVWYFCLGIFFNGIIISRYKYLKNINETYNFNYNNKSK